LALVGWLVGVPDNTEINADTAEGRIYLAARKIAEEMALMSQAAARGANSEVRRPSIHSSLHTLSRAECVEEPIDPCAHGVTPHCR
jgi:hypothetical protein